MTIPAQSPDDQNKRGNSADPNSPAHRGLPESLRRVVQLAAQMFSTPIALAVFRSRTQPTLWAVHGVDAGQEDTWAEYCSEIAPADGILVIPDILEVTDLHDHPMVAAEPGIRFFAGVSLTVGEGDTVATLCILDVTPRRPLSEREEASLTNIAAILADEYELERARVDTQRQLATTQQQLDLIVENAPVGIAILNRDMEYLTVSDRWRRDFHFPEGNIVGRSHYEMFPNIPKAWKAQHRRCLSGEVIKCEEQSIQWGDGTIHWIRRHLVPWFDADGNVGGAIFINDFTTERKRAAEQLEQSQRFLSAILHNITDGIFACDEAGRHTIINQEGKRIVGTDLEGIHPNQWKEFFEVYDDDGTTPLKGESLPLYRALRGETVKNQEIVIVPPGRTPRICIANGQPLIVRSGQKIGAVVSVHDITRSKEIEAQYRQAQKMEAVGQLTGGLAHDFNNLLAVIIGNLQLVQRTVTDQEKVARRVAAAIDAARRGAGLTERLLAFARRQRLECRLTNVNKLIRELRDLLQRTLGDRIRLETVFEEKLWCVRIDHNQLDSAILNLCINARDAMPKGGKLIIRTKNITLHAGDSDESGIPPGEYVRIGITDTGAGIPHDIRGRVFEPFFTTKEAGTGSGLGLSMVYGFIRQSGGHVTLHSRVDRGTTVNMYLPRCHEKASPKRKGRALARESDSAPSTAHILVVEEDDALRDVIVGLLLELGHDTAEAREGREALAILKSTDRSFDILLTDFVLRGELSGPDLARIVREKFPGVRILFTSDRTGSAEQRKHQDGTDTISKPFLRDELAKKIHRAMERPAK